MGPPLWLLVLGGLVPPLLLTCIWLCVRLARAQRLPPPPPRVLPPPPPVPVIPSVIRVHLVDERPLPVQEVRFAPDVRENDPEAETQPMPRKVRLGDDVSVKDTVMAQRDGELDKAIEQERAKLRRR